MFQKITEYLAWIFGCVLLGGMAFNWMFSGNFLQSIVGLLLFITIVGSTVLFLIREVLYYAQERKNKKDGQ